MDTIAAAIGRVGVGGILLVVLSHVPPVIVDGVSWRILVDPRRRPSLALSSRLRWYCESVNTFIPTGYLGGELVRIRIATRDGMPMTTATASITVDALFGFIVQIAFSVTGVLAVFHHGDTGNAQLGVIIAIPALIVAFLIGTFTLLEKSGALRRFVVRAKEFAIQRSWDTVSLALESFNAEVSATLRDARRLCLAGVTRILGWVLGILEVWLALRLLGHPVGFAEALMLEAITQAARSIAFAVPSGIGVQEGSLVLLGASVGVTPDAALALSLLKRVRELLLGVPGFVFWQLDEGVTLVKRRQESPE
jgi:putative membrane protein